LANTFKITLKVYTLSYDQEVVPNIETG